MKEVDSYRLLARKERDKEKVLDTCLRGGKATGLAEPPFNTGLNKCYPRRGPITPFTPMGLFHLIQGVLS